MGPVGSAPPGWYATDQGWRWWDGYAWGLFAPPPVPDEESGKTLAILTHLGVVFGGFIVPLVIYLTEGKKNAFVHDHSREALNFQITFAVVWFAAMIFFLVAVVAAAPGSRSGPPVAFFFVFPLYFVLWALALACGITGAVRAGQGRHYRYPISIRFVR